MDTMMDNTTGDILTPPSTAPEITTSCHIFGCNPLCTPDNLCCPLRCSPTCPHSNSVFRKPSITTPEGYQPSERNRLKRPYVADPDSITNRYSRHSQLPALSESFDLNMAPVMRPASVPLMDLTPTQTNTSHYSTDTTLNGLDNVDPYDNSDNLDNRPSTGKSTATCTPSPSAGDNFRSRNLSRLFYTLGSAANSSTAGIKRRRLTSAFGGTEKVYLNGPVYELQKSCQDCWRAIKGIDMELEDLELRYVRMKESGNVDDWEYERIEVEFNRLTQEKSVLEEEYAELVRVFEQEKEKLNREFSFREKVKKGAKNVWKLMGGKKSSK